VTYATKTACQLWRAELSTCAQPFELLTDSVSGKRFTDTTEPSDVLKALWEVLKKFNLKLLYFDRNKPIRAVLPCQDDERLVGEASSAHQQELAEEESKTFSQPHQLLRLATSTIQDSDLLIDNNTQATTTTFQDCTISFALSQPENSNVRDGLFDPTGQDYGPALNAGNLQSRHGDTTDNQPNNSRT
jgi:hypothetical protein